MNVEVTDCTETWYRDLDGDGYGDGGSDGNGADTLQDCTQPTGYVAATMAGDCDDSNVAVNPGEPESCIGLDDK